MKVGGKFRNKRFLSSWNSKTCYFVTKKKSMWKYLSSANWSRLPLFYPNFWMFFYLYQWLWNCLQYFCFHTIQNKSGWQCKFFSKTSVTKFSSHIYNLLRSILLLSFALSYFAPPPNFCWYLLQYCPIFCRFMLTRSKKMSTYKNHFLKLNCQQEAQQSTFSKFKLKDYIKLFWMPSCGKIHSIHPILSRCESLRDVPQEKWVQI